MKRAFKDYLISIGILRPVQQRVEAILGFYASLGEQIEYIFVTDHVREDGTRAYGNLWLFSDRHVMEAKDFVARDTFDMSPIQPVHWWEVNKEKYDFSAAVPESRMSLDLSLQGDVRGHLSASGNNCDRLKQIILKYILPNMSH